MISQLFPDTDETAITMQGVVDHVENGIGSGPAIGQAGSFDFPIPEGFGIGTIVEIYEVNGKEYSHMAAIRNDDRCTIFFLVHGDEGYAIAGREDYSKGATAPDAPEAPLH
jgi:hypothetical protein